MSPEDWREVGRLEMELYGYVISEEAAMALVMPISGIGYENAEAMMRRYEALTKPPGDA